MGESVSTGTVTGTVTGSVEHLPECAPRITDWGEDCICKYLRACEKRMLAAALLAAAHHGQKGYEVGFRKGLDAAREAVTALPKGGMGLRAHKLWREALSAIDALRGSGNPDTPPSAEKGEQA